MARVRKLLTGEHTVIEKSMFGGRVFMVNGHLIASAGKAGELLVRVPGQIHLELCKRGGAQPAHMGERSMGEGWITVEGRVIADDDDLAFWIDIAVAHSHER